MRLRDLDKAIKDGTLVDVRENKKYCNAAGTGLKVLRRDDDEKGFLIKGLRTRGGNLNTHGGAYALARDIFPHVVKVKKPKFQVKDLVDAELDYCGDRYVVAAGKITEIQKHAPKFKVEGNWTSFGGKTDDYFYVDKVSPHVPVPKDETRGWAIVQTKAGKKVRNRRWSKGAFVVFVDNKYMVTFDDGTVHNEPEESALNISMGDQWEVVEEALPPVGSPEWAEVMGKRGEKVRGSGFNTTVWITFDHARGVWVADTDERVCGPLVINRQVWSIYTPPAEPAPVTELDAGTKTAIAVLESKQREITVATSQAVTNIRAKANAEIESLEQAIAILKGRE